MRTHNIPYGNLRVGNLNLVPNKFTRVHFSNFLAVANCQSRETRLNYNKQ